MCAARFRREIGRESAVALKACISSENIICTVLLRIIRRESTLTAPLPPPPSEQYKAIEHKAPEKHELSHEGRSNLL